MPQCIQHTFSWADLQCARRLFNIKLFIQRHTDLQKCGGIFKELGANVHHIEMCRTNSSLTLAHSQGCTLGFRCQMAVFCVLSITLKPLKGFSHYLAQNVLHFTWLKASSHCCTIGGNLLPLPQ